MWKLCLLTMTIVGGLSLSSLLEIQEIVADRKDQNESYFEIGAKEGYINQFEAAAKEASTKQDPLKSKRNGEVACHLDNGTELYSFTMANLNELIIFAERKVNIPQGLYPPPDPERVVIYLNVFQQFDILRLESVDRKHFSYFVNSGVVCRVTNEDRILSGFKFNELVRVPKESPPLNTIEFFGFKNCDHDLQKAAEHMIKSSGKPVTLDTEKLFDLSPEGNSESQKFVPSWRTPSFKKPNDWDPVVAAKKLRELSGKYVRLEGAVAQLESHQMFYSARKPEDRAFERKNVCVMSKKNFVLTKITLKGVKPFSKVTFFSFTLLVKLRPDLIVLENTLSTQMTSSLGNYIEGELREAVKAWKEGYTFPCYRDGNCFYAPEKNEFTALLLTRSQTLDYHQISQFFDLQGVPELSKQLQYVDAYFYYIVNKFYPFEVGPPKPVNPNSSKSSSKDFSPEHYISIFIYFVKTVIMNNNKFETPGLVSKALNYMKYAVLFPSKKDLTVAMLPNIINVFQRGVKTEIEDDEEEAFRSKSENDSYLNANLNKNDSFSKKLDWKWGLLTALLVSSIFFVEFWKRKISF